MAVPADWLERVRALAVQHGQGWLAQRTGYKKQSVSDILKQADRAPIAFVSALVEAGIIEPPPPPPSLLEADDGEWLTLIRRARRHARGAFALRQARDMLLLYLRDEPT